MYDVTRKGKLQVFRVAKDGTETLVSNHVEESEAIGAANTHGERNGGGTYRLQYPDKMVRVIIQGPAPVAPVIAAAIVIGSTTELDIIMSVPALGVAPPFSYELEESSVGSGGPFVVIPSTFTGTPLRYRRAGLPPGGTRYYRARAFDVADPQRVSVYSNIANATVPLPASAGAYLNWPVMNLICLQGDNILDPAEWPILAMHDGFVFQGIYPTQARIDSRSAACDGIDAFNANRPQKTLKFLYIGPTETWKVIPNPGNNEKDVSRALIGDPVKGNPNWIVHRVGQPGDAGRCEAEFDTTNFFQCNMAIGAGVNSLNQTYPRALWTEWIGILGGLLSRLDGIFHDVYEHIPPPLSQNNGALAVTDPDYEGNGVAEVMDLFGAAANAGARKWCEGELLFLSEFDAIFGPTRFLWPNLATFNGDYKANDGPLPMSTSPYYRKFLLPLDEVCNFEAALRITASGAGAGTTYNYTGNGSMTSFFRMYEIQERLLKFDANVPAKLGRACVPMHVSGIDRVATQDDITFLRFWGLIPLLVERAASCVQLSGRRAFQLDELLLEFGNPIGLRSMGTFSEATGLFTMRAPDRTVVVGATTAQFYWVQCAKAMATFRLDAPTVGIYPSADAAITCPLPTPPPGFKHQAIQCVGYTNPLTGCSMSGQTPALNHGGDLTGVSLKPWHVQATRIVPV